MAAYDLIDAFHRAMQMTEEEYYNQMLEEVLQVGTAEEKRIAAMSPEQLHELHKYGTYSHFSPKDPPNLNRLHRFIQEIIEQNLEEKFAKNEQFIEQYGIHFTNEMMDILDRSLAYWKDYPDKDFLPYLYADCLTFCMNNAELQRPVSELLAKYAPAAVK